MPDKIKEAFTAINDKELFLDEQDFRDNVMKDPKGTFEALNNYGKTKGFFLDYGDFESALDLKKKAPKAPSIPTFSTSLGEAIQPLPNGAENIAQSPLKSNLKSEIPTVKPIDAKTALLNKAAKEQNLSNPLEGTKQTDAFIEENKQPTVLTMAKAINNKSQERVKVLTERVGILKGIKDFQAQEPAMQEDIQNLSTVMQDVNQPIQNRQAAQEQLKQYQEQFKQFDNAVNNYKGLIDKEKSIITDIHKDEDLRQKGLVKEYNSFTGFVDAIKSSTVNTLAGTAGVFNTLGLSGDPENPDSDNNEQVQNEVRNNIKTIKSFGDSLVTQETPKDFEQVFKGKFSSDKLKYILAQGIGQTIPTVAAGFLGGAGGATITGAGLGFIESKDMFKTAGLNDKQSDWAALGLSIPLGILEEWGISDIIAKPIGKLILKETTEEVVKSLAKKELTNEAIFETVKKTLGAKIKEYSIDVAKAGWKEPLTEMEQAALSETAKQGAEAITGKDSNVNQTLVEYLKQTGTNIAEEGVYGFAGGVGMSAVTSAIQNRATPSAYERAIELKNPELLQDFTAQLDEEVKSGRLTQDQAQIALDNVKKIQEADAKIPTTIKGADRRTVAAALVTKKEELKAEIEGKDEALATPIKDEIKLIDEKLISISKGEPIKETPTVSEETSPSEGTTITDINQKQEIKTSETPKETTPTTTPSSNISSEVQTPSNITTTKSEQLLSKETPKAEVGDISKEDENYKQSREVTEAVSKENPDASILITPKGNDLNLTAVYIGKEKRGQGIGSKVLESVKRQADKLGKKVVLDATNELDEETDLERLGNFYEKNGFVKVGENKFEYNPKETPKAESKLITLPTEDKSKEIALQKEAETPKKQFTEKEIKDSGYELIETLPSLGKIKGMPTLKQQQELEAKGVDLTNVVFFAMKDGTVGVGLKKETNLTEKAPIGETTEKPILKEATTSESPVFDEKNMTKEGEKSPFKDKSKQEFIGERLDKIQEIRKRIEGTSEEKKKRYDKLLSELGDGEKAIIQMMKEDSENIKAEIDKLPKIPRTKVEEQQEQGEKLYNKAVSDLGFKSSERQWGDDVNPFGEEMGDVLQNKTKDASIFIKPNEVEAEDTENDNSIENVTNGIKVELLYTDPKERGKGKAKELLRKVTKWADENNATLFLDIAPQDETTTDEGLKKLYEAEGFVFSQDSGERKPLSQKSSKSASKKATKALNIAEVEAVTKVLAAEENERTVKKMGNAISNNKRINTAEKEIKNTANAEAILAITKNLDMIRAKLLESGDIKTIDCSWVKK